ncbi:inner membrane protein YhjD [Williamsia deligens]|uniref:Inner membrane protein YhjD n=1 Tax=Williamsia deligens TaxID=321325 RepID=A0ABW3GDA9_9NOCA|nr:inner membrane protein YhjD [Williamsia deligens]MCP2192340.1 membrane protein [Williamsia deligens]
MADTTTQDDKPSRLDTLRARYPWLDHLVAAGARYQGSKGDFFAAGATYFSVLALFPLLMVAFAIAGFVFVASPDLLDQAKQQITDSVSGDMGNQLNDLMDQAISSRTSIGLIGLLLALYSGLGWMANLRNALTVQWGPEPPAQSFVRTKIGDLGALLGLFVALAVSFGLSALAGSGLTRWVLDHIGVGDVPGIFIVVRVVSVLVSLGASTLLFTWAIARLPRIPLPYRNAVKAGLLTAVVFEVFKLVATFYLRTVLSGPAGATFGPIIGIMVFAFFTTRIVLFATAWAATDEMNRTYGAAAVPDPVVIEPRVVVSPTTPGVGAVTALVAGAVTAVGVLRWRRRD